MATLSVKGLILCQVYIMKTYNIVPPVLSTKQSSELLTKLHEKTTNQRQATTSYWLRLSAVSMASTSQAV